MMRSINPFNITKAVDYSDQEINKYWVDMPGGNGFSDIMKPESPMPMMILGGKGSGKTHIMRYFSYNLQKIRFGDELLKEIIEKKYIGIFLRCGGLNSSKFDGVSQTADAWKNIFSYYFELWISQLVLNIVADIFTIQKKLSENETQICEAIKNSFDVDVSNEFNSIKTLQKYLQNLQKQVDFEVNNCAITGKSLTDLKIQVSPGRLIFGIPQAIVKAIPAIKDVQFIYLIDEYENLLEYQQKYINTLIREREFPVSFRIGARWYGIKTYQTFSGDEELKVGSEYDKVVIDQQLRQRKEDYKQFAAKICISRLQKTGYLDTKSEEININSFFEEYNQNNFFNKLLHNNGKLRSPYFLTLKNKLIKRIVDEKIVNAIIKDLKFDKDLLLERTNVFLFYRQWNNKSFDLKKSSKEISVDCIKYYKNSDKNTAHYRVLDKFKFDVIDWLHRENRTKLPYIGLDKLIRMSAGIPRHLLIVLKHVFRWSNYYGEDPFVTSVISAEAQHNGVEDAIKWFIDDARVPGPMGNSVLGTIDRIGQYLHILRFADVPPECSISSFSINSTDITEDIRTILDYLEQYSYLIKGGERREKNSSVYRVTYRVNGLIAPNWELALSTRGVVELNSREVAAIFMFNDDFEFNKLKEEKKAKYNAPFRSETNGGTLFDMNNE